MIKSKNDWRERPAILTAVIDNSSRLMIVAIVFAIVISIVSFISPANASELTTQLRPTDVASKVNPCSTNPTSKTLFGQSDCENSADSSEDGSQFLAAIPPGCYPAGTQCRAFIQKEVYCCGGQQVIGKRVGWCIGWYDGLPCR